MLHTVRSSILMVKLHHDPVRATRQGCGAWLAFGSRHRSAGPSVAVVAPPAALLRKAKQRGSLASLSLGTLPARTVNVPLTERLATRS